MSISGGPPIHESESSSAFLPHALGPGLRRPRQGDAGTRCLHLQFLHHTEQLHLYSGTMFVNSDGEEEELRPELVFSLMDFIVVALLLVVTFLWFRSKHVNRFYEACKESQI